MRNFKFILLCLTLLIGSNVCAAFTLKVHFDDKISGQSVDNRGGLIYPMVHYAGHTRQFSDWRHIARFKVIVGEALSLTTAYQPGPVSGYVAAPYVLHPDCIYSAKWLVFAGNKELWIGQSIDAHGQITTRITDSAHHTQVCHLSL